MPAPLLLFRVGWMDRYNGPGPIFGGGSHVVENKSGGEMWNFAAADGLCHGYVMSLHFSGLDLGRLADPPGRDWLEGDELEGVDVGFFSRKERGARQVVVGCYLGATVYHKSYRKRPNPSPDGAPLEYLCEVNEDDAVLLPPERRRRFVPYAPVDGRGYPGQSNVWYGDDATPAVASFTAGMRVYLRSLRASRQRAAPGPGRERGASAPDHDLIREVERRSMEATRAHFRRLGYRIRFVHRENRGWDITATKGLELLQLEVKGHVGDVVAFELSPNEYATMRVKASTYRVCLVRNALTDDRVEVLEPFRGNAGEWHLRGEGVMIALGERVGAKASQVS